ncbi:MAG: phosphoribosylanthranilate isomerase [Lysobacterales bacterium]
MSRVRIKICGLTRTEDIETAVAAGADALGFVFVPASPRCLEASAAALLCARVPAFVCRVGLFLNQEPECVRAVLKRVPLSLLQFHGDEDAGYCGQFGLPYVKAIRGQPREAVALAEAGFADAAGILVDSHLPGGLGGTGLALDWNGLQAGRKPLILAGGLNPFNVAEAIRLVRPWAVDVSSGVELAPGIKDANAVRQFINEARSG